MVHELSLAPPARLPPRRATLVRRDPTTSAEEGGRIEVPHDRSIDSPPPTSAEGWRVCAVYVYARDPVRSFASRDLERRLAACVLAARGVRAEDSRVCVRLRRPAADALSTRVAWLWAAARAAAPDAPPVAAATLTPRA